MPDELENYELGLLLDAIEHRWGYDFRDYARASIRRRVHNVMKRHKITHVSELIPRVLHTPTFFQDMVLDFSITVTEMFRDPQMWHKIVTEILPRLRSWPYFKIWHAACATGEEVWSMAILLKEAGMLDKAIIYATDFNDIALHKARKGIFLEKNMEGANRNYIKAGGEATLSKYYTVHGNDVIFDKSLAKRVVWANHNLTTDRVFGEMNLIMCRNALIYFNPALQNQVLSLFTASLSHGGFLCLGSKESLEFTSVKGGYTPISLKERLFCKSGGTESFMLPMTRPKSKPIVPETKGIVAIGCSMGGTNALKTVLAGLPLSFPMAIVITQHVLPSETSILAKLLQQDCALVVKEAEEGESIKVGYVYVAPSNYHLLVEENMTLSLSSEERQSYARPSIDVMFDSVANASGTKAIGVILTGGNADGAEGLATIRKAGGYAIIEDPNTANTPFMPNAALTKAGADEVLSVEQIPFELVKYVNSILQTKVSENSITQKIIL